MKILLFAILLFFLSTTPANAQVVLSEVYPAPTSDQKEWVELYNTSDEVIGISGWKLFEHFSNKSVLTTFTDVLVEPHGFFVFELSSNKLNNAEEKVSLENPDGVEVSSLHYINSESQKSFSVLFLDETTIGSTLQITQPTQGTRNQLESIPTPAPKPSIQPTVVSNLGETPSLQEAGTQNVTTEALEEITPQTIPLINEKLELHKAINSKLKIPGLDRIEKEGLEKRLPQLSYLVQKKVSKEGVINAIIGGSLLLLTGLLL